MLHGNNPLGNKVQSKHRFHSRMGCGCYMVLLTQSGFVHQESLSYSDTFVHNVNIKRCLEGHVLPLFTEHHRRTDQNSCLPFYFIEWTSHFHFALKAHLIAVEQYQYINIAIGAGITTSLRAIEYGCCCWSNTPYSLTNLIDNIFSTHNTLFISTANIQKVFKRRWTFTFFLRIITEKVCLT